MGIFVSSGWMFNPTFSVLHLKSHNIFCSCSSDVANKSTSSANLKFVSQSDSASPSRMPMPVFLPLGQVVFQCHLQYRVEEVSNTSLSCRFNGIDCPPSPPPCLGLRDRGLRGCSRPRPPCSQLCAVCQTLNPKPSTLNPKPQTLNPHLWSQRAFLLNIAGVQQEGPLRPQRWAFAVCVWVKSVASLFKRLTYCDSIPHCTNALHSDLWLVESKAFMKSTVEIHRHICSANLNLAKWSSVWYDRRNPAWSSGCTWSGLG